MKVKAGFLKKQTKLINLFKILFLCFTGPWEYDKKIEDSGAKSWKERK